MRDVRGETVASRTEETPCATHHTNVVQTPWARRTAFQDGCVDVAHDGVRDSGGRRKTKRKIKKREKKKARRSVQ